MHCEFCASTDVIFEEFARRCVSNDLEFDDVAVLARERRSRAGSPVEQSAVDRNIASGVEGVDRLAVFGFGERDFFEGLHRDLTVSSVLVPVSGYAMAISDHDRFDGALIHSRSERNLEGNDLSHSNRD